MLTDTDLQKIDKLITTRLDTTLKPMQTDMRIMQTDMRKMQSDIVKIRKDMNIVITYFDHEYLDLRKRIERIEEYLKLQPTT